MTFRFTLSDREFRRAWLREYYRRPGWRGLRFFGGPAFILLGAGMASGTDLFMRIVGAVTVAFGIYYGFKPFLMASAVTRRRRAAGHADRELAVTVHSSGIRIDDGQIRTELPWVEIESSGLDAQYVWYQMRGGNRATIPRRVVSDFDALRERLEKYTAWKG